MGKCQIHGNQTTERDFSAILDTKGISGISKVWTVAKPGKKKVSGVDHLGIQYPVAGGSFQNVKHHTFDPDQSPNSSTSVMLQSSSIQDLLQETNHRLMLLMFQS